jgi:hypothetical protein
MDAAPLSRDASDCSAMRLFNGFEIRLAFTLTLPNAPSGAPVPVQVPENPADE